MQIDESLQRILSQNELVIERFYLRFLKQHANARKHFAAVDMKQQSLMLTMALMTVEGYYRIHIRRLSITSRCWATDTMRWV